MKKLISLFFLLSITAWGADVRWTFVDFTSSPQSIKKVYITPIAAYGTNSTNIVTGDRRTYTNSSLGSLIVSNVIVGRSYRVELHGSFTETVITNSFDSTVTGFVEAVNYIAAPLSDGGLTSYSKTAADARFHNVSGDTSTNAAFRGTFKIPAGASVGYVLTATNADGSGAWQVGGGGSSIAAGTNIVTVTNGSLVTVHGTANVTQSGLAAGSYAVVGANVFSAGTTNLYAANSKNNYSIGTNLTILSAGSHNNVLLGGNSGEIENSIYSTIIGSNPGGSQIRRSSTSVMISANDGNMTDATGCVILGGEHPWIFGGVGALAGHYNVIIGGNTAAIGNEFDNSKYVRGNVIAGGQENRIDESVSGNVILGGNNNIIDNATNSFASGNNNDLSGHVVVGLGSLLTNTQNHEVMLGKYGTELRIKTNGVTSVKYISMQGGATSGNLTNTANWQFGLAGVATGTRYTNGTRRGILYFSGETAEFGAMVATSIVTYDQNNSNTNTWGKQTIFDDGSIAGAISVVAPVNPSQVYYVNTYGSSVTTTFFKIVFE